MQPRANPITIQICPKLFACATYTSIQVAENNITLNEVIRHQRFQHEFYFLGTEYFFFGIGSNFNQIKIMFLWLLSYVEKNDAVQQKLIFEIKVDHFVIVHFFLSVAPSVELTLGRMVNAQDLEEDDDIYFSCSVNANPPAYKLTWWHNVS